MIKGIVHRGTELSAPPAVPSPKEHMDHNAIAIAALLDRIKHLEKIAYQDALTGIGNRAAYEWRIKDLWLKGEPFALILIDANGLKTINDTQGHLEGDRLIQRIAHSIRSATQERDGDFAARIGGDEFAILVRDCSCWAIAAQVAERILWKLDDSIAIGWQLSSDHLRLEALIESADASMYADKEKNRCCNLHQAATDCNSKDGNYAA